MTTPHVPTAPTHADMLSAVKKRVPHLHPSNMDALATAALLLHAEPRHHGKSCMHCVKMAIARSHRHPK